MLVSDVSTQDPSHAAIVGNCCSLQQLQAAGRK